jgi:glycine/D-amino acid oxidase-like deaminating enzyme
MLNLRSNEPLWLSTTPQLSAYPVLHEDITTEIVVVGGGISGALAAYELINRGCKVTLVTAGHIGTGSTCASTALLQYEIDTPLVKLINKIGQENATKSYLQCYESIDDLKQIHKTIGIPNAFQAKKSLLLASKKDDVKDLEIEYTARQNIGLRVKWLDDNIVKDKFGFNSPAAIYSDKAGQTDAYIFTQKLIEWCVDKGMQVFDQTGIVDVISEKRSTHLQTDQGYVIKAKYVVMATGYDSVKWINKNVARLHSTYAITSKPFDKREKLWKDKCLIWETARPYSYMRVTKDNRVVIGGKDETFSSAIKRDKLLNSKAKQLQATLSKYFPHLRFDVDYKWAGTFADTADGLPFIGGIPAMPRVYFSLGFGGNGITFSQIASKIIADAITNRSNNISKIFSFERLNFK